MRDPRHGQLALSLCRRYGFESNEPNTYSAAGHDRNIHNAGINFWHNGKVLGVNGVCVGEITDTGDNLPYSVEGFQNVTNRLQSAWASWKRVAGITESNQYRASAEGFWRTVLADQGVVVYHPEAGKRLPAHLISGWRLPSSTEDEARLMDALIFAQDARTYCRFFVTSQGLMGIGPPETRENDLIYVLFWS